jgi:hypothetical protein
MKNFVLFAVLGLLFIAGCGPSNEDITKSRVNVVARKEFNDTNFKNGGQTGEFDAWGSEMVWSMDKGPWNYGLYVRSFGPDKLPYTQDDIVAKTLIPRSDEEGVSEHFVRGISRGWMHGINDAKNDQTSTIKSTKK